MAGEPQTDVQLSMTRLHFLQNDTQDIVLLGVPDGANFQLELLSISVGVGDNRVAGGTLSIRPGWVDDSDSDAVALLASGTTDPETLTARVVTELFRGSQILDPGDTVFMRCIADNNAVTLTEEETAIVEYRIVRRS